MYNGFYSNVYKISDCFQFFLFQENCSIFPGRVKGRDVDESSFGLRHVNYHLIKCDKFIKVLFQNAASRFFLNELSHIYYLMQHLPKHQAFIANWHNIFGPISHFICQFSKKYFGALLLL